jgi:hypothetical protein
MRVKQRRIAGSPHFARVADRRIRELLKRGDVGGARAVAARAAARRPASAVLAHWAEVLSGAPAQLGEAATGRSRQREATWLRQHASEYEGQWVALVGDRLISASPDLSVVRDALRASGQTAEALLHFVPQG